MSGKLFETAKSRVTLSGASFGHVNASEYECVPADQDLAGKRYSNENAQLGVSVGVSFGIGIAVFVGICVDVTGAVNAVDVGMIVLVEIGKADEFCPPHDDKITMNKNNASSEIIWFLVNIFSPLI